MHPHIELNGYTVTKQVAQLRLLHMIIYCLERSQEETSITYKLAYMEAGNMLMDLSADLSGYTVTPEGQ